MEEEKRNKLYQMLKHMSDYSIAQPKVIEVLCNDLLISPTEAPVFDLLVEAFFTVHSFSLLMFNGLVSNASAILRILIEQVSALTVIARKPKAITEYLKFQSWKQLYYSSTGIEHERRREFLVEKCGYKKESAIKDYLDYGWIRVINDDKSERGDRLIIKEAHLEEMIKDINEQLGAFAHGQRSIYSFGRGDLADKHVARIIMVAGKLFLFLCHDKQELLVNHRMEMDKYFNSYLNAKIIYLDLNARSTNERIIDFIKHSLDLDAEIRYSISTVNHARGLIYQSYLNTVQINVLGRAYVLQLTNVLSMLLYKQLNSKKLDNIQSFGDLIKVFGFARLSLLYDEVIHTIPFIQFFNMIEANDDNWCLVSNDGQIIEESGNFITDFTTYVHYIFSIVYPDVNINEILDPFVTIE